MTGPFLKDLRNLRVLVCHPDDREGEELVRHLHRIGCQAERLWPVGVDDIQNPADLILMTVNQDLPQAVVAAWQRLEGDNLPSLIALVDYESPTTLQRVLELNPNAVIGKPIRPFGLLTNVVVARQAKARQRRVEAKIRKLESKLRSQRTVNQAKAILMDRSGISEREAHELIRKQAMSKRVSTEEIARSILNAEELLQFPKRAD